MKDFFKKIWESIDGWKTIVSLLGIVAAFVAHYRFGLITEGMFEQIITYLAPLTGLSFIHHIIKALKDLFGKDEGKNLPNTENLKSEKENPKNA